MHSLIIWLIIYCLPALVAGGISRYYIQYHRRILVFIHILLVVSAGASLPSAASARPREDCGAEASRRATRTLYATSLRRRECAEAGPAAERERGSEKDTI